MGFKPKMKNFLSKNIDTNSIYLGIKKGLSVPLLPEKLDKAYNHIFTRILRVIGGTCFLLSVTSAYLSFPSYLHMVILVIGGIQSIQMIIISFVKFFYGVYTLRYHPEKLEVRN